MPTVLMVRGWRFFFYSNEGNEPMHIHARKGGAECKYWLLEATFDIEEAYAFGVTPQLRREVRQIIFEHFEELVQAWRDFFGG